MIRFPGPFLLAIAACSLWSLLCGQLARADAPTDNAAASSYIEGIEALNRADFGHAVQALTQAINSDGDNASYRRARGVAYTLSESFADGIADLERAQRLDPNDMEARLWAAAAYRMSGDVAKGASLFTMRDLPHDYANMVYNLMAMQYWQSRYQGHYLDPSTKRQVQVNKPVKTLFADAARAYAQRNRATGAAAVEVITAQMNDAIKQGDWCAALQDVVQLRTNAPDDPTLRGDWCGRWSERGTRWKCARSSLAPCASRRSGPTDIWAGAGHMILGDGPRASRSGSRGVARGGKRGRFAAASGQVRSAAAPADAVEQFENAVQGDAKFTELVDDALAVHHLTNSQRLRYDESYQLRIRVLSEAMRDHAGDADYPEMLARFLYNYYQVPIVWNGPRGAGQQLRRKARSIATMKFVARSTSATPP